MSIFKCKMCGGTIEFEPGATIGVCDSCGTKQTLPRLDDDRRANLYDRANHFRRNNDFDKAAGIYEQILNEDPTDAEAYWSLVLCRYGIEYVEDPTTRRRVPTVNRTQFTSIFDDDNYKSALQYADTQQRTIYEGEAIAINEIQKGILAISQKEEPFDVFICYKETDQNGRRTPDSVLANDLYHQLNQEGFKVFFARITLEDKLGSAYEPYIFAALNSASVMVVLGTKPEYFNAVWVKNEWSRYLSLVKKSGGKKVLIPAYKDMDPYDLPEEFSHLQAQDMSKLGFMQDLIRGIKKIAKSDEPRTVAKETVINSGNSINIVPLLKRAFMFLEDKKWEEADEYCEKVLDQDPENAKAYLGKLMAEFRCHSLEDFANLKEPFDSSDNFQKVVRFGEASLTSSLKKCIDYINERNENARLTGIYDNAVNAMHEASSEAQFRAVAEKFRTILGFKDADALAGQCLEKAEVCRKDIIYETAHKEQIEGSIEGCESAIKLFESISGWKDADEQSNICRQKIKEIKAKEENDRLERERWEEQKRIAAEKAKKKRKKIAAILIPVALACLAFVILLKTVIIPQQKLKEAVKLLESGDYEAADSLFEEIGNKSAVASSKYDRAKALIETGDYEHAIILLNGLNYKDSSVMLNSAILKYEKQKISEAQVGSYVCFGAYEQDNDASNGKEDIEWLVLAKDSDKVLIISKYALDCQKYNNSFDNVTWETCSLREWLNSTFMYEAFNSEEQNSIISSTVTADPNPSYDTPPGNDTIDKVFLLSFKEVGEYFSLGTPKCQGTVYCNAQSGFHLGEDNCCWWLRSPGMYPSYAAYSYSLRSFDYDDSSKDIAERLAALSQQNTQDSVVLDEIKGRNVDYTYNAVRPAMWINLEP